MKHPLSHTIRFISIVTSGLMILLLSIHFLSIQTDAQPLTPPPAIQTDYLIDDFAKPAQTGPPRWEFFTDGVMGGKSTGRMAMEKQDNAPVLRLTGKVSLENNGGFIQARRMLTADDGLFDATAYTGVRLRVKGNGEQYAIHLRTNRTWLPWQFYQADFTTTAAWQEISLPFDQFQPNSINRPLDTAALKSVAVVAIKKAFDADLSVDSIQFYRKETLPMNELTDFEKQVILQKGTERAGTGAYTDLFEPGVYACKQCLTPLYEAGAKFHSDCGWPSFDDALPERVKRQPDADGRRVEILCATCDGHLGHVFTGEKYTPKDTRHCVNSISLVFIPAAEVGMERAIFASGCFWGVQHWLDKAPGVLRTSVGYIGGHIPAPTYKQVCTGATGHAEAVEVVFNPKVTTYEKVAQLFFETHDFTQLNRQGPDIGHQYRSGIFYLSDTQKQTAQKLIDQLKAMGHAVKTELTPATRFWSAEDYHQDYYAKKGELPYCHSWRKIF